MKLTAFSGGFGYPSTTTQLVNLIVDHLGGELDGEPNRVELRDVAGDLPDATTMGFPSDKLQEALKQVEQADLLVAASATFRGSYAGLFKAFFDLVDPVAMREKPVILAATGETPRHQLVIDHAMRPLFSYFGCLIVPTSVYATPDDWVIGGQPKQELDERVASIGKQARAILGARPKISVR